MPLVKICGLMDKLAVTAAVDAGADAIGFVFATSLRRVSARHAAEIAADVPRQVRRVAVMLHPSNDDWLDVKSNFRPDVLQTDLADFNYLDVPQGIERWPVVRDGSVPAGDDLPETFVFEGTASGSGEMADWQLAAQLAKRGRMILAGGLSIENVTAAIMQVAPFGIDVSSGVEALPGKKDTTKIKAFIDAVRAAASATKEATI